MAFIILEDETSKISLTLFPNIYSLFLSGNKKIGDYLYVEGKVDLSRNVTIIVNSIRLINY